MKGNFEIRKKAIALRKEGKTYSEVRRILTTDIPKSTLSYWFKNIKLSDKHQKKIKRKIAKNVHKGRIKALAINRAKREKYLQSLIERNKHLSDTIQNKDVAKIALAMLYLGDGSKSLKRGSMMFGNSDPFIVSLFLDLLRYCYDIDETKFRCTVQCRADQNTKELEEFWPKITKIPASQFYKTRIDPRTKGKRSKKRDYKGVCRIDYFSAETFIELMQIPQIIGAHGAIG